VAYYYLLGLVFSFCPMAQDRLIHRFRAFVSFVRSRFGHVGFLASCWPLFCLPLYFVFCFEGDQHQAQKYYWG
jgi:hypothetical protein